MRPVNEGYCLYHELIDGTLDLVDVANMNDTIEIRDENSRRARKSTRGR